MRTTIDETMTLEDVRIKKRKKVYMISAFSGDIDKNVEDAREFARYLIAHEHKIPIASHLFFPQIFGVCSATGEPDDIRHVGMLYGLALMELCDEVYVFTNGREPSAGMEREITEALMLRLPITYITEEVETVWRRS